MTARNRCKQKLCGVGTPRPSCDTATTSLSELIVLIIAGTGSTPIAPCESRLIPEAVQQLFTRLLAWPTEMLPSWYRKTRRPSSEWTGLVRYQCTADVPFDSDVRAEHRRVYLQCICYPTAGIFQLEHSYTGRCLEIVAYWSV